MNKGSSKTLKVGPVRNANDICVLLIVVWLIFLSAGCATSPVMTPDKERAIGAEQARNVEQVMGLVEDPKLVRYLQALGRRLVVHSPPRDLSYTFYAVDMVEPNAFALPGGYIFVSRGLLALVNEEDQLAGVLAHEIAHVTSRHHAKSAGMSVITSPFRIATGIVGAATGIVAPRIGGAIAGVGQIAGAWTSDEIAVANALQPQVRLQEGQIVKVPIWQPYVWTK